MFFWIICAIVALTAVYFLVIKPQSHWKNLGVTHAKPKFLFGENLGAVLRYESFTEMVQRVYSTFPGERYAGFYQFLIPTLMLRDPDLIKQITVKDFDHFVDHRSFIPEDTDPLFGKNLFALKGERWRHMRATLSPSFTSSKMKAMFHLMSEVADGFAKHFANLPENTTTVEMKNVFTRYTNDVIATTAFGIKVDSVAQQTNEFYLKGKEITDFTSWKRNLKFLGTFLMPKLYKFFKIGFFEPELTDFFSNLIKDTIRTREKMGIVRPDMLNLLMEARKGIQTKEETDLVDTGFATVEESEIGKTKLNKQLTEEDLIAQAFVFFFAGFDAVSSLISFMAYELGVNQDIQDKLRQEIKETQTQCKGKLTYESLMNMKYMDMVVSESLRKWPNAVGVDRICTKPYTIQPAKPGEKPLKIDINTVLFLPIFGIHRDPQYYPDPEKFDPERFSDENKDNIKPYTYLPFGVGPRNCIGSRFAILETKVLMFHLLNNIKIVPTEKSVIPMKIGRKSFNLAARDGFWFGFQKL